VGRLPTGLLKLLVFVALPCCDAIAKWHGVAFVSRLYGQVLGTNELSGSVTRNMSGFGGRYESTLEPDTLVTGDPDDEVQGSV
jgi:hypothetical protein